MTASAIFSLLFVSAIIVTANLVEQRGSEQVKRGYAFVLAAFNLPLAFIGLFLLFVPGDLFAAEGIDLLTLRFQGWSLLYPGVLSIILVLPPTRQLIAKVTRLDTDSAVHTVAMMLIGYLVGTSLASVFHGGLEVLASLDTSTTIFDVILNQLLFFVAALFGVGMLIRRSDAKLRERLGLLRPTGKQLTYGLTWILPLVIFQYGAGALWTLAAPEQAAEIEAVNGALLQEFDTVGEWFVLGAAPGISEEVLFRGALQPIFGLWPSAFLFAIAHTQYALSPATGIVFVLGLALGHIRRRTNTTVAIMVHFGYNFLLGLITLLAVAVTAAE